ncbi:hypothetical protein SUGI_0703700 [Cryptomeria japonica]|nr:hypothetical protein SUGI_0703700 [Cryptomeria japonica]
MLLIIKETVIDDNDNSIYGVVFQWRGTTKAGPGGPPSEVVAFRGTLLRPKNIFHDLVEDMKVAIGHYNSISRVQQWVQQYLACRAFIGSCYCIGNSNQPDEGRTS